MRRALPSRAGRLTTPVVALAGSLPGNFLGDYPGEVGDVCDLNDVAQTHPLSCGAGHSAMLTREGQLWTW